jgi:hypothetical protein
MDRWYWDVLLGRELLRERLALLSSELNRGASLVFRIVRFWLFDDLGTLINALIFSPIRFFGWDILLTPGSKGIPPLIFDCASLFSIVLLCSTLLNEITGNRILFFCYYIKGLIVASFCVVLDTPPYRFY